MSAGFMVLSDTDELTVPPTAAVSLAAFREWALSDEFPTSGRIDYVDGNIEVSDMAGEELDAHGALKMELARTIANYVRRLKLGYVYTDSTRVSCPNVALSVEPDVVFVSYDAIESARVLRIPKAGADPSRFVEIEGPPDLVVEVVSDSTVRKDTVRLLRSYFEAGVVEYWLADGRKSELTFVIHQRGEAAFEPAKTDDDGFQTSTVLGQSFRLDRNRDRLGSWQYELVSK